MATKKKALKNPKKDQQLAEHSNLVKNPDDWVSGDEHMTGAQASYLKTLSEEAGTPFPDDLTKAEASKKIDALRHSTGHDKESPRP